MTLDPAIPSMLRLGLAGILLASGWSKLRHPQAFSEAIEGYRLALPGLAAAPPRAVAGVVLLSEGAAAAGLLAWPSAVAVLPAAMLFAAYGLAIGFAVQRGQIVDCGCSLGVAAQPVSTALVYRNLVLAACALVSGAAASPPTLEPLTVISTLFGAGLVIVLYAAFTTLVANAHHLKEHRP